MYGFLTPNAPERRKKQNALVNFKP
jgi:hypothetical protein